MFTRKQIQYMFFFALLVFVVAVFFLKATLVNYRYHLDPRVVQPLGQLLESNLDRETNVMFPWLGLRLFYILTVCFKTVTWVSYFALTKYWFIFVSMIFLFVLYVFVTSRYKHTKQVMLLAIVFLLLLLQNDFFLRRLSMTVRENYALIALIGYLLVYYKSGFNKTFSLWIFSWAIYWSNPITSFVLLGINGLYGLYTLVKKDWIRFVAWIKQFVWWIIVWLYFFIEFVKSLFWQYEHVEEEVVLKNPYAYDFYYISDKHINSLLLVVLFLSAIAFIVYGKKQKRNFVRQWELFFLFVIGGVYIASFFPQVWLYQDRLIMYISILAFLFIIPFLSYLKHNILLFAVGAFAIIKIWFTANYQYYSPFDLTRLDLPAYEILETYTGDVLLYEFDEYVLKQKNPFMKVNHALAEQFAQIVTQEELTTFLSQHTFILFLTKATMRQENEYYKLPAIQMLTDAWKIMLLEDGNALYIHAP